MHDTELEDDLQATSGWWVVGCIIFAEVLHIAAVISVWEWARG